MEFLFHHMLEASTARLPEKEAVVHGQRRFSYRDLAAAVENLARHLSAKGIRPGDRVCVLLPPSIEQVVSFFAISRMGAVFVPINSVLKENQVRHILEDSMASGCISGVDQHPDWNSFSADAVSLFLFENDDSATEIPQHSIRLNLSFSNQENSLPLPEAPRIESDLAAILYTSGSTGMPKGVMLSHQNILAGASIVSDYLNIDQNDRILAVLPFSFDAGLNQLTTSIQQGATLVLVEFMFAREVVKVLNDEQITGLAGVPPFWNLMVQKNSTFHRRVPSSLRYITNTGGAVSRKLLAQLQEILTETDIVLMYGLTEAFRSTYLPPDQLKVHQGSMGRAIPNTEIFIVREDGSRCEPNEVGELVHRGPTVAMGYWNRPEETSSVFRDYQHSASGGHSEKVVYSGDLVYQDEHGFFHFVGRRDSQIKSSGYRISPTEVEEGIMQTGLVQQVAVVGLNDELLGQRVHAAVILENGGELDVDQIRQRCAELLPRHMIPLTFSTHSSFPRTSSGKIDYASLRESLQETAVERRSQC